MVDLATGDIVHIFSTEPMRRGSLRHTYACQSAQTGLTSLTLSYVSSQTGDLVIHTYLPKDDNDTIYSYNPSEPQRRQWGETTQITRRVPNPGKWETLSSGRIVGVRQQVPHKLKDQEATSIFTPGTTSSTGLRRRSSTLSDRFTGPNTRNHPNQKKAENDVWEAWVIDHLATGPDLDTTASIESIPLNPPTREKQGFDIDGIANGSYQNLMISELGPLVKLGTSSVAVGFGNVVKIISVGLEYFDGPRMRLTRENLRNLAGSSRRKRDKDRSTLVGISGLGVQVPSGAATTGPRGVGTRVGVAAGFGIEAGGSSHDQGGLISGRARGESIKSYDWGWAQDR